MHPVFDTHDDHSASLLRTRRLGAMRAGGPTSPGRRAGLFIAALCAAVLVSVRCDTATGPLTDPDGPTPRDDGGPNTPDDADPANDPMDDPMTDPGAEPPDEPDPPDDPPPEEEEPVPTRSILPNDLPGFGTPALPGPFAPSMVLVTNEAELREAAVRTRDENLNVVIDRTFAVRGSVYFPPSDKAIRLIGANPDAGIFFDLFFDGDWGNVSAVTGLDINARQVTITGLTFTGFETRGAAVRCNAPQLVDISNCRFQDNGTVLFPFKVIPPTQADDTISSSCLAAHGVDDAHISIVNCVFANCANNVTWSHCVYVEARSILITGNRFSRCGAAFRLGNNIAGSQANILHNEIHDAMPVVVSGGLAEPPYLYQFSPNDLAAFAFNRVTGAYDFPLKGFPRFDQHFVDFNDYTGLTYTGAFGSDVNIGHYDWPVWQSHGFDVHSAPPEP